MKRTVSLLLAAALWGTTTGCYCMPYGGGMGFPLGCPPNQPTQMMPTPVPSTGYNMIDKALWYREENILRLRFNDHYPMDKK